LFSYDAAGNPIEQPVPYVERVELAANTIAEADITMLVLVDEIDNPLWCTYGRRPNNAFFIGVDGRVILVQDWNNASEMEEAILRYLDHGGGQACCSPMRDAGARISLMHKLDG